MRAELSPAQRAEHLARRKEIWELIDGQNVQQSPGRPRDAISTFFNMRAGSICAVLASW
jgi:hypothetical protein